MHRLARTQCARQVGVVRQVETAAIKKAGDNKSGPFERRMTALHTRATLEVSGRPQGVVGGGFRFDGWGLASGGWGAHGAA